MEERMGYIETEITLVNAVDEVRGGILKGGMERGGVCKATNKPLKHFNLSLTIEK
jgi:hypothetical protein